MNPRNPWSSYQQVATQTAPPGQLVLMLFDGVVRFLNQALTGFGIDDPAESNQMISNNIIKAQAIVFELNSSLNMQDGGELAQTLRGLYSYMDRRLNESNMRKDPEGAREVLGRINILREAWMEMLNNQGRAAANPQDLRPRMELAAA